MHPPLPCLGGSIDRSTSPTPLSLSRRLTPCLVLRKEKRQKPKKKKNEKNENAGDLPSSGRDARRLAL